LTRQHCDRLNVSVCKLIAGHIHFPSCYSTTLTSTIATQELKKGSKLGTFQAASLRFQKTPQKSKTNATLAFPPNPVLRECILLICVFRAWVFISIFYSTTFFHGMSTRREIISKVKGIKNGPGWKMKKGKKQKQNTYKFHAFLVISNDDLVEHNVGKHQNSPTF
jgi:hypothetical protein